jgi:hypothetical protein
MLAEQRERGAVGSVGAGVLKRSVRVLLLNTTGGRVSEDLLSPLITRHLWGGVAEGDEVGGQGVECRDQGGGDCFDTRAHPVDCRDQQTPLGGGGGGGGGGDVQQRLFDVAFFVPNDSFLMSLPTSSPTSSLAAVADACITTAVGDGGVPSSDEPCAHDYVWQLELLNQWVKLDAQYVGCTTATTATTGITHVSRPCEVCAGASSGWVA